mmetsp:Transcript_9521/g.18814  ORF Transcript_9521/g.18814 Transcript_9521/m.18814 type:complete len:92 (-) Transcript_9521:823-1098(-)
MVFFSFVNVQAFLGLFCLLQSHDFEDVSGHGNNDDSGVCLLLCLLVFLCLPTKEFDELEEEGDQLASCSSFIHSIQSDLMMVLDLGANEVT